MGVILFRLQGEFISVLFALAESVVFSIQLFEESSHSFKVLRAPGS